MGLLGSIGRALGFESDEERRRRQYQATLGGTKTDKAAGGYQKTQAQALRNIGKAGNRSAQVERYLEDAPADFSQPAKTRIPIAQVTDSLAQGVANINPVTSTVSAVNQAKNILTNPDNPDPLTFIKTAGNITSAFGRGIGNQIAKQVYIGTGQANKQVDQASQTEKGAQDLIDNTLKAFMDGKITRERAEALINTTSKQGFDTTVGKFENYNKLGVDPRGGSQTLAGLAKKTFYDSPVGMVKSALSDYATLFTKGSKGFEGQAKGVLGEDASSKELKAGGILLAGLTATDFIPSGKGTILKELGRSGLRDLSKASTEELAETILQKSTFYNQLDDVAKAELRASVAKTPNKANIRGILQRIEKQQVERAVTDVNTTLNNSVENNKTIYPQEGKFRKAERQVNPFAPLARLDEQAARQQGIRRVDLPADESLEALADIAQGNTSIRVNQKMKDYGVDKVIQKYGEGTPNGKEFRNYQNAKFGIEVAEKRGLKIIPDEAGGKISLEELQKFVNDYELKNPVAMQDNEAFKKFMHDYLDRGEAAGRFAPGTAEYIKKYYQNYVPINRLFPENLERASLDASPLVASTREKILQRLEGSGMPIDNSFGVFIQRAKAGEKEIAGQNLFDLLRKRTEEGSVNANIIQSKEQVLKKRELQTQFKELNDIFTSLKNEKRTLRGKTSKTGSEAKASAKELVNKVRATLRDSVADPDARAAIGDLTDADLVDIARGINESGEKGFWRNYKKFANKSEAHQVLLDDIVNIKSDMDAVQGAKGEIKQGLLEVATDSTTGRQVISGVQDGVPVKIEVSPELATVLQGLDQRKLSGFTEFMRVAQKPFRTAFTGWANPVFSAMSFAFYDLPITFLNSPQGVRNLVSPRAIGEMFKSLSSKSEFQKILAESGAQLATGSLSASDVAADAAFVASRKNLFSKTKYALNPKNIKQTIEQLDLLGGKLQGATRTKTARVAYDDAIRKNLTPEQAIANAVYSYNNIMPNYRRTSTLLKNIDAVIPYTSASVAGTRSLGIATRRSPIKTLTKAGILLAPGAAVVAHNMGSAEGEAFYQDSIDSKNTYLLDNNLVIVMPGAKKDEKTGKWEGIIKIPVAPELRAMNGLVWRQARDAINGNGMTKPQTYANAIFDTATGGTFSFVNNPAVSTAVGLATGKNLRYGNDIVPEDIQNKPKNEQTTDKTTGVAKTIGNAIGQSPVKVQFVIDQFGAGGRIFSGNPAKGIAEEVKSRFTGFKTKSSGQKFYEEVAELTKDFNPNEKAADNNLHPKAKNSLEEDISPESNAYNAAARLDVYNRFPRVYEKDKEMDRRRRAKGLTGNPLFDLTKEQLKKVLEKENLPPGAKDPELSNLYKEDWFADYQNKKQVFFSNLKEQAKAEGRPWDEGDNPYPVTSPDLQKTMDYYSSLPKGTGDRSGWIKANPDAWKAMTNQFAAIDNWQNKARGKRGLAATEGEEGENNGFGSDDSFSKFFGKGGKKKETSDYNLGNVANMLGKGGDFVRPTKIQAPQVRVKIPSAPSKAKKVRIKT